MPVTARVAVTGTPKNKTYIFGAVLALGEMRIRAIARVNLNEVIPNPNSKPVNIFCETIALQSFHKKYLRVLQSKSGVIPHPAMPIWVAQLSG